jgi:sugar phosphate isomerase/epimerase
MESGGMLVGIKLDLDWEGHEATRRLYGDREVLATLRARGVGAVELPVEPRSPEEAVRRALRRIVDAGLRPSLHPYSEGTRSNPALFDEARSNPCQDFHRRVFLAAAEATEGGPVMVNVHPAAGYLDDPREELLDRSVAFFRWALRFCGSRAPRVRPVAELQGPPLPGERVQRAGDIYDELLEVAERSGVSLCWDFGHALLSHQHRGAPLDPPEALLGYVAHAHCHDVHGIDHRPLLYDVVPWRRYLGLLLDAGFDGTVILEVSSESFLEAVGLETLDRSLAALAEALGRGPTRPIPKAGPRRGR